MQNKVSPHQNSEYWKNKLDKYMKKQNNSYDYDSFCTLMSIIDRIKEIELEIKNGS